MSARLNRLKEIETRDHGSPEAEWSALSDLIFEDLSETTGLLRYLLTSYQGYVDTRIRAGVLMMEQHPHETRENLKTLLGSSSPDDRDTALGVLRQTLDVELMASAKPILYDPFAYLQIEAADLLLHIYPEEAMATLQLLAKHHDSWLRALAERRLEEAAERPENDQDR
jgi:hypothetical protein